MYWLRHPHPDKRRVTTHHGGPVKCIDGFTFVKDGPKAVRIIKELKTKGFAVLDVSDVPEWIINEYSSEINKPVIAITPHNLFKNPKPVRKRRIENNEKLNKNRVLVYTCVTGDYDLIEEYKHIEPNCHYVCFTNNSNVISNTFSFVKLQETEGKDESTRLARKVKLQLHKYLYLDEYDYVVWLDANCMFRKSFLPLIDDLGDDLIALFKHNLRDCLYDEGNVCIEIKKDAGDIISNQLEYYKKKRFPKNYGLWATHCLVYKPTEWTFKFFDIWYKELCNGSRRDQISLPYALKTSKIPFHTLLNTTLCDSTWNGYVSLRGHNV